MRILECSDIGDKRFSEYHAKVKVSGIEDTIYNHLQLCKRFNVNGDIVVPKSPEDSKDKAFSYFVVDGKEIPCDYLHFFYKLLWIKYLSKYPSLAEEASNYDEFNDSMQGENWESKVEIIRIFAKEGRQRAMEECEPFLRLLSYNPNIIEIKGDAFDSNKDIIALIVNCKGLINSGIANEIQKKYPNVYEDYYYLCKQYNFGRYNMGECQLVEIEKGFSKFIANLFCIEEPENSSSIEYNYLEKALIKLKEEVKDKHMTIAIPYDMYYKEEWDSIKQIIETLFNDYPITIYK